MHTQEILKIVVCLFILVGIEFASRPRWALVEETEHEIYIVGENPKVGDIFEVVYRVRLKPEIQQEYGRRKFYITFFSGSSFKAEVLDSTEITIPSLIPGEWEEFRGRFRIPESYEMVFVNASIRFAGVTHNLAGASLRLYLIDSLTGQYGTKDEYDKCLYNSAPELFYDPLQEITLPPGERVDIYTEQKNKEFIEKIEEIRSGLTKWEKLYLLHDAIYYPIRGKVKMSDLEAAQELLENGWLEIHRTGEGAKKKWLEDLLKRKGYSSEEKEGRLNFFRPADNNNNNYNHGGNPHLSSSLIPTTFTGTWFYKNHYYNKDQGLLATGEYKGVPKATMAIWAWKQGTTWKGIKGRCHTDTSGDFTITVDLDSGYLWTCWPVLYPIGPDVDTVPLAKVRVSDPNPPPVGGWRLPEDSTIWWFTGPQKENCTPGINKDFGACFTDTFSASNGQPRSGAVNIYDVYQHAMILPDTAPSWPLRVMWEPGYDTTTKYKSTDTIFIFGDTTGNDDEWNDDILLHEFGHYLMNHYAKLYACQARGHWWHKSYSGPGDTALGYVEGWASFFSGRARSGESSDSLIVDTDKGIGSGRAGYMNIENPWDNSSAPSDSFEGGPWCEGAVAGVLWDIYDSYNENPYPSYPKLPKFPDTNLADAVTAGFDSIWTVFDDYDPRGDADTNCKTIFHFRSGWIEYNYNYYFELDQIYMHHRVDVIAPSAPYITKAQKSDSNVILTWRKITTDTLDNSDAMNYYIIYRNTSSSYVPDSLDSIGAVANPETTFTDTGALNASDSYYYLVMAVDSSWNKSKKSNMGYVFHRPVNENPGETADRNWVSLPWHSEYDTIYDLTNDLSPNAEVFHKVTHLVDTTQDYFSWFWHAGLGQWMGDSFAIVPGHSYEFTAVKDSTIVLVGANSPDSSRFLNENPGASASDRNWVGLPYNAAYSTVSDITDELAPSGSPINKVTHLVDSTQMQFSYFWHLGLNQWLGINFAIEPGHGYEFVATKDSTWNPTEWSNEEQGLFMVTPPTQRPYVNMYVGTSLETTRAPVWFIDEGNDEKVEKEFKKNIDYCCADLYRPVTATLKSALDHSKSHICVLGSETYKGEGAGEPRGDEDERNISHLVWTHLHAVGFENIVFTTYRLKDPHDVLTEKSAGSVFASNAAASYHLINYDVGNFRTPWKHGEEVVFTVEATKEGKAYYDVIGYKLDDKVDIQVLRDVEFKPYSTLVSGAGGLYWNAADSDNIVGYSLYQNGTRLNEKVLTQRHYRAEADVNVKLVIKGGYETVYGSQGIQSGPEESIPISYAFSINPNPFITQTRVDYALPKQTSVEIVIYDVSGRKIKTLASEIQSPGYYSAIWNGIDDMARKVASGVYFIRFDAGEFRTGDKILLVK